MMWQLGYLSLFFPAPSAKKLVPNSIQKELTAYIFTVTLITIHMEKHTPFLSNIFFLLSMATYLSDQINAYFSG